MRLVQRFFSRWQNWGSFLLILAYVGVAIAAPYLSPEDPKNPGAFLQVGRATEGEPQPPDEKAILGMLPFGIDVYHALLWGSRDALQFGLIVTISTAVFGVLYGAISGFAGSSLGNFMIRVSDAFLAFPPIAGLIFLQQLLLTTVAFMGDLNFYSPFFPQTIDPEGPAPAILYLLERINPLMLSLIVFSWMPFARLVHSIVLTLKQTDFVQAARALGGSPFWIIRKHILRNSIGPAIVLAARDVGGVVLFQATLTFIGIGGDSVWGQMISQGRNWVIGPGGNLFRYWWVWLPPTLAVMFFGIAWNMFGDSLNDALEPTSQRGFDRRPFWGRLGRKKVQSQLEPDQEPQITVPRAEPQHAQVLQPEITIRASSANGADQVLRTARDGLSSGDLLHALH